MSRAVHQFFDLILEVEDNRVITDAWEGLSNRERLEALALADAGEFNQLAGPDESNAA